MADFDCEYCKHDEICKYRYFSTNCMISKRLELVEKIPQQEKEEIEQKIQHYKDRDEDLFSDVIQGYERLLFDYPDEEELEYAKKLKG